ncbi:MAG: hypothetical protein IJ661_12355 [Lachnospiraceae bacterium]|nr:hypothetical protein [Lachnospiraceae bacterium]
MLLITLIVGLIGAILMFAGDMTLYYDPNDYDNNGSLEPVINIMKKLPKKRVMIGGIIGPVAAFLYCIGFYHIVLMADESVHIPAIISFLLCCMGIISGGAYHSHCAYLGLLGEDEQRKDLDIVMDYLKRIGFILYGGEGAGLLIFTILILMGRTMLSAWMAVLSPVILFLLKPLARKLPKGLHMVICGGFSNVIFVVYYVAALIVYTVG